MAEVVVVVVSTLEIEGLSRAPFASDSTDWFGVVKVAGCTCGGTSGGTNGEEEGVDGTKVKMSWR